MRINLRTKIPGSKSKKFLDKVKKLNLAWNHPYPFVHSSNGSGCYFEDIDGNILLDFGSQIASNPLGYNHPEILSAIKDYAKRQPVKFAGQDFTVEEHVNLLEELLKITPKGMDKAFLINSGAEAVENSIKTALRYRKTAEYGAAFQGAFHGRTLGALSCTDSKPIQKESFLSIPIKRLQFDTSALDDLKRIISENPIGFVIMETIQGEGGYNVSPKELARGVRKLTKDNDIPLIFDEVQSGMGRTGKWWAFQNFDVDPDIFSVAKALQVGATVTSKKYSLEPGSISSTWGGGHIIDMAIGLQTIKTIKKQRLLEKNKRHGEYLKKRLLELSRKYPELTNVRGIGLMVAVDLSSKQLRDNLITEMVKRGLVILGCGKSGIRLIPPYIVTEKEIDEAMDVLEKSLAVCLKKGFKHTGDICNYLECGETAS